jgi:hypothetical protein
MQLLAAIAAVLVVITSACLYPEGFINQLICGAINIISSAFPSTPDNLKLSSIVNILSSSMPVFGKVLIQNIIGTIRDLFVLYSIIKIYKLIPFKAT